MMRRKLFSHGYTDRWLPWLFMLSALGSVVLNGCSGDTTGPTPVPFTPSNQLYWALVLNETAVNLALTAPYDTMQLIATPVTEAGTPLTGASPATFQAAD